MALNPTDKEKFTKEDIASVVELKFSYDTDRQGNTIKAGAGKVFLLIGPADEKIVIKTDADIKDATVRSASIVATAIDKNVKVAVLDKTEKDAVIAWIKDWEAEEAWFKTNMGKEYRAGEKDAVDSLKNSINYKGPEPWFKMAALEVKDLEGALEKRLAGDKSEIKAFTATLVAKGGLEKLGQVIAADMFNGNTDRFKPTWAIGPTDTVNGVTTIGNRKFNLRVLINVKNVFVAATKAGLEISALDYIDPNSRFKDFTVALAAAEANAGYQWLGKVLVDKKLRSAFADDIVHDLEKILNPNKSKLSLKTKLGSNAAARLIAGMITGAAAIKTKLDKKYPVATRPAAVKERIDLIATVK